MAGTRRVISFFLASPGDLTEERKIAKLVVDELNSMFSLKFNVHIELVGWEDTVSSAGRPQEIINRDLERCDVFIGLLWKRWGSPPDNESKYESGFEEEFTIATSGHKQRKKPQISLFFKDIDTPALSDPGEQLQKVIAFKKKIIDEKTLLFQNFENKEVFESVIRKCISSYVLDQIDLDTQPQATHAPDAEVETTKNEKNKEEFNSAPIQGKSANFIKSILQRIGDGSNIAKLEPFEVARLRLIANGLGDSQNDNSYLGTHDANLIYKNKDKCKLQSNELLTLLQAGARNLKHENTPIWHWLKHPDNAYFDLSFLTLTIPQNDHTIINSILDLMTLTETKIETKELLSRQSYIQNWLSEGKSFSVKNAALRYLCENGLEEDLVEIQKEINRNDSQTIALAHEAYVSIKIKTGLSAGLKAINDLQPTELSGSIIDRLFKNHSHIPTEDLYKIAENRNKIVREKSIKALISRDLLSTQQIELLQQDPEPNVRALTIPALLKQGAGLSESEAKAIIIKVPSKPTSEEMLAWSIAQPQILSSIDSSELERGMHRSLPLNSDAYIEFSRRKLKTQRPNLTKNLLDKYESFYYKHLRLWAEANGSDQNTALKQFDSLKQFIINNLIRKTLTLLAEKKSKEDLPVIRTSLIDPLVIPTLSDLEYFYAVGEWQDAALIANLIDRFRPNEGRTLLGGSEAKKEALIIAVKTILKLGKNRLADVLSLDCPSSLKRNLISSISDKYFITIGDDTILDLLNSSDSEIRKHCALKCAKTYSKAKLTGLLNRYIGTEQTFYNVIHWLDFGVHASKSQIKSACENIFIL